VTARRPRPGAEATRQARQAERDAATAAAARSVAARILPLAEWQRERLRQLLDLGGGGHDDTA
jgi:hypothetical protein